MVKRFIKAANKRKRQDLADLIFVMSHSVMNENWKEVYELMLGEKLPESKPQKEKTPEQIVALFTQALGGAKGMVKR